MTVLTPFLGPSYTGSVECSVYTCGPAATTGGIIGAKAVAWYDSQPEILCGIAHCGEKRQGQSPRGSNDYVVLKQMTSRTKTRSPMLAFDIRFDARWLGI